jgi:membrane-associated protease RseP (regulator of RpoE activity)
MERASPSEPTAAVTPPAAVNSPRVLAPAGRWLLQLSLFLLTVCTTTGIGMRYMDNFNHGRFPLATDADVFPFRWVMANFAHIRLGLPFSGTLLLILLTHEFGHYFACRLYGVRATLPYVLPAPSLSGTAGAIIRLKSRLHSRAALMAIGAFGPLSGFVVALVTTIVGMELSRPAAVEPERLIQLQSPLLFKLVAALFHGAPVWHAGAPVLWHPVLLASWIGLLITALNLTPAGQFDGGHILYALSPRLHRYITYSMIAVLCVLGVAYWVGWLAWAALLAIPAMRHPAVVDDRPLPRRMLALAPLAFAVLVLTVTLRPFTGASLLDAIHRLRGH